MKMFMKILVSTLVIAIMMSVVEFESTCSMLEQDVLRLHILANSDTQADQQLKLDVRDKVLTYISPLYESVSTKDEALEITEDNLELIENIALSVVQDYGCDYSVQAKVMSRFFDTRYYEDFTMPAGVYDTLQIEIGQAKGKNWWCVMYPTLCVGASTKESMKDDLTLEEYEVISSPNLEFKFKIVEYFEKISELFR